MASWCWICNCKVDATYVYYKGKRCHRGCKRERVKQEKEKQAMRYLYIFEDGTAAVHNDPTPLDYHSAKEGVLQIFRFVPNSARGEVQYYNPNSENPVLFDPVPKARITSDGNDNLWHEPEYTEPEEEMNHLEMGDFGDSN